jgi:hypothetical protein
MSSFKCFDSSWITIYQTKRKVLVPPIWTVILIERNVQELTNLRNKLCVINDGNNADKELEEKMRCVSLRVIHIICKGKLTFNLEKERTALKITQ